MSEAGVWGPDTVHPVRSWDICGYWLPVRRLVAGYRLATHCPHSFARGGCVSGRFRQAPWCPLVTQWMLIRHLWGLAMLAWRPMGHKERVGGPFHHGIALLALAVGLWTPTARRGAKGMWCCHQNHSRAAAARTASQKAPERFSKRCKRTKSQVNFTVF